MTQRHDVNNCCGERGASRLAWCRIATNHQSVEKTKNKQKTPTKTPTISAKHNKMIYAYVYMCERKKEAETDLLSQVNFVLWLILY